MDYHQFITAFEDVTFARRQKDIFEGWMYSTGALFEGVGSGNTKNVYIENPNNSGNYLVLKSRFSVSGEFFVKKIDSVTKDTDGSSLTKNNRLLSDGSSSAIVEKEVAYSNGNEWTPKVVGSGSSSAAAISGAVAPNGEIVLQEDENVIFEATNKTTESLNLSIDIDFYELPNSEIPELG